MKKKSLVSVVLSSCLIVLLVSCASTKTKQSQYVESEGFLQERDYASAIAVIEEAKNTEYKEKDRVLYYLDIGMLYHYAGEYQLSNQALSEAEWGIEELYTKSVSKSVGSGLLNDNALDYSGEDYEDIYLNIFKALNYIALEDSESALVEIRRIDNKLKLLEDKHKQELEQFNESGEDIQVKLDEEGAQLNFHNDALARLLGMLLYRYEGSFDDARIDREKIEEAFQLQTHIYNFAKPAIPEIRSESVPMNFIIFTGRSPNKVAETYYINSSSNWVTFARVEQDGDDYLKNVAGIEQMYVPGIDGGFHMKFQFPRLYLRGSNVSEVKVNIDGNRYDVQLIEDMEHIANVTFLIKQPLIIAKTVTRAIIKGIAKEIGKDAGKDAIQDSVGGIEGLLLGAVVGLAADVAVDATENADLRISQFFPAYALTAEVEVEPGLHNVQVEYYGDGGILYVDELGEVNVTEDQLNLFESFYM